MLMSRFDPTTGKIVYGRALGQSPATMTTPGSAIKMPDGSTQTYTPSVVPQDPNTAGFGPLPPTGASAAVTLPQLSVGPSQPDAGGGMMRKPYGQFLSDLEKSRGLPDGYLARTRAVESANGTNLQNPNSSAKGPFQFIDSTAKAVGLKDPMDPYASATAAADLAQANAKIFQQRTGQAPTGADLYGMHQQGPGGYLTLTQGGRTSDAAMNLNGGAGLSPSQMVAKIHGLYNNAQPANLGDGFTPPARIGDNQGQGPTVANAANLPQNQPDPAPAQAAAGPKPPDPNGKFTGGLFGMMQGDDYTGAGSAKDTMGKLGDVFGDGSSGSPIGTAVAGLAKALAPAPAAKAPPMQALPDLSNTPNMAYLQMLMKNRGGGMMGGGVE